MSARQYMRTPGPVRQAARRRVAPVVQDSLGWLSVVVLAVVLAAAAREALQPGCHRAARARAVEQVKAVAVAVVGVAAGAAPTVAAQHGGAPVPARPRHPRRRR